MVRISKDVVERLYCAENLKEIMAAFDYRARIKTRWNTMRPKKITDEIKEIDLKTDKNWTATEVSKAYRGIYDNYFHDNIGQGGKNNFTKEWHSKLKRLCNYGKNFGLLDL